VHSFAFLNPSFFIIASCDFSVPHSLSITSPVKDIGVLFFCCPGRVADPAREIPVKSKIAAELVASNFMVHPTKMPWAAILLPIKPIRYT
jgi:hypothetical protein